MGIMQKFSQVVRNRIDSWSDPWKAHFDYYGASHDKKKNPTYNGDRLLLSKNDGVIEISTAPIFVHHVTAPAVRPISAVFNIPGQSKPLFTTTSETEAIQWLDDFVKKTSMTVDEQKHFDRWKNKISAPDTQNIPVPHPVWPY